MRSRTSPARSSAPIKLSTTGRPMSSALGGPGGAPAARPPEAPGAVGRVRPPRPPVEPQDLEINVEPRNAHRRGVEDGPGAPGGGDQVLVQPRCIQRGGELAGEEAQSL